MIYAVIDTNVFVSAYLTHNLDSATTKVVAHLFNGHIKLLYNDEILSEYRDVLSRSYLHISKEEQSTLLEYIVQSGTNVERTPSEKNFIDEDDRIFYEVALSKEDSFLVTGNLKHYPNEPHVVTPAQMLQIIETTH